MGKKITTKTIRLKGHIGSDKKIEIKESVSELFEGDVDIILLYHQDQNITERFSPLTLPTLNGRKYLGGSLRREDIYGDNGR